MGRKNGTREKKRVGVGVGDRDVGFSDTHGNVWRRERHRSLAMYTLHAKLEESICQSLILCSKDPKQSHIGLGTLQGFLFLDLINKLKNVSILRGKITERE